MGATVASATLANASGAVLVAAMWWWSAFALRPAGLMGWSAAAVGDPLTPGGSRGLGPRFTIPGARIDAKALPAEDDFSALAGSYERYVRPFSAPVFAAALERLAPFLALDARVLDLGCGPGAELRDTVGRVPRGEVVGVDIAAGMVRVARQRIAARGIANARIVHADAADLPRAFGGAFDLAYSCFAHHHFPDPLAATRSALSALRPGGVYCLIDVGEPWFTRVATPLARWADPGWVSFSTPDRLRALLLSAGAARSAWMPLAPGVGMAVGQVPLTGSQSAPTQV
jgi:SAM-dependent methyltransferase